MIRSDFQRIFRSWKFYAAFLAGIMLILHPLADVWQYRDNYSPMLLLSLPLAASDYTPFAALFCILPFADSYCEDTHSGNIHHILCRTGIERFIRHRCISVGLTGGIVSAGIMAITIVICALGAGQPDTEETIAFMSNTVWYRMGIILLWKGNLLYILRIVTAFLFGVVWAMAGLAISALYPNRYVTLIAPFLLYQILWFLLRNSAINPVYLLRGDIEFIPSFYFIVLFQAMCITCCFFVTKWGVEKRCENGNRV